MKVGVVGCGNVGSTAAYAIAVQGNASELVLVDLNERLAHAQAEGLLHATPFAGPVRIRAGGYPQPAGTAVVVLACGPGQKPGETRLQLLQRNRQVLHGVAPQILVHARDAGEFAGLSPYLPRIVGAGGVVATLRPDLSDKERNSLRRCAEILREAADQIDQKTNNLAR